MLIDGYILGKDFKDELIVDGFNIYDPDTVQYCFYTLADASNKVKEILGDCSNKLLVFPFQSGIQFTPFYHILNMRDLLCVIDKDDIESLWKGDYNGIRK